MSLLSAWSISLDSTFKERVEWEYCVMPGNESTASYKEWEYRNMLVNESTASCHEWEYCVMPGNESTASCHEWEYCVTPGNESTALCQEWDASCKESPICIFSRFSSTYCITTQLEKLLHYFSSEHCIMSGEMSSSSTLYIYFRKRSQHYILNYTVVKAGQHTPMICIQSWVAVSTMLLAKRAFSKSISQDSPFKAGQHTPMICIQSWGAVSTMLLAKRGMAAGIRVSMRAGHSSSASPPQNASPCKRHMSL
jgi:hypothetical protein